MEVVQDSAVRFQCPADFAQTITKYIDKAEVLSPLAVRFTFKPNGDRELPLILGLILGGIAFSLPARDAASQSHRRS